MLLYDFPDEWGDEQLPPFLDVKTRGNWFSEKDRKHPATSTYLDYKTDWWFGSFFIFHNIWDVILPIDELHHFSRWLLHHQPENN